MNALVNATLDLAKAPTKSASVVHNSSVGTGSSFNRFIDFVQDAHASGNKLTDIRRDDVSPQRNRSGISDKSESVADKSSLTDRQKVDDRHKSRSSDALSDSEPVESTDVYDTSKTDDTGISDTINKQDADSGNSEQMSDVQSTQNSENQQNQATQNSSGTTQQNATVVVDGTQARDMTIQTAQQVQAATVNVVQGDSIQVQSQSVEQSRQQATNAAQVQSQTMQVAQQGDVVAKEMSDTPVQPAQSQTTTQSRLAGQQAQTQTAQTIVSQQGQNAGLTDSNSGQQSQSQAQNQLMQPPAQFGMRVQGDQLQVVADQSAIAQNQTQTTDNAQPISANQINTATTGGQNLNGNITVNSNADVAGADTTGDTLPASSSRETLSTILPQTTSINGVTITGRIDAGQVQLQGEISEADSQQIMTRALRGMQSVVGRNGGNITLRLTPPEMGTLRIEVRMANGMVAADFHASNAAAGTLLSRNIAILHSTLESHGLTVENLNVQVQPTSNSSENASAEQDTNQAYEDGRSRGMFSEQNNQGDENGRNLNDGSPDSERTEFEQELLDLLV